jgi:hypothetical protein
MGISCLYNHLFTQFSYKYEQAKTQRIAQLIEQGFIQDPFPACTKLVLAYEISIYNLPEERNFQL